MWIAVLAALVLAAGGCEQQKTPQVAPTPKPAADESKGTPPEQKTALPVINEKIEQAAAEPPVSSSAPEAAKPPAPEPAIEKPAAAEPKAATPSAKAAVAGTAPPKTVVYEASFGKVSFDHPGHSGHLACGSCHTTDPPVKIAIDKDKAHELCKGCHQEKGAGPTQCGGCHKKG
jgi:hypothetical protein